jgi:hypothetical protein
MKAPICCAIAQKTAIDAMTFAEVPEFGQGEVAERPMAVPKASRTNDIAAAKTAPAKTEPHSTKLAPAVAVPVALEASGAGPTCVMAFSPSSISVEPEQAQDEHHNDDEADEIDDAVHGNLV